MLVSCGKSEKKEKASSIKNKTEQTAKTKDTTMTANNTEKYKKPAKYPADAINELNELFSSKTQISVNNLDKIPAVWEAMLNYSKQHDENLKNPDSTFKAMLNSMAVKQGFKDWSDCMTQTSATATSMAVLTMLNSMENNKGKNDAAYGMAKDMSSNMIKQGHISKEDLKIVYDNWDKCKTIMLELDKFKK